MSSAQLFAATVDKDFAASGRVSAEAATQMCPKSNPNQMDSGARALELMTGSRCCVAALAGTLDVLLDSAWVGGMFPSVLPLCAKSCFLASFISVMSLAVTELGLWSMLSTAAVSRDFAATLMGTHHLLSENVGRSHLILLNKVVAACRKRHTFPNYEVCQPTFDSWLLHKSSLTNTREEGSPCTGCGILSLLTLSLHVLAGKLKELHVWWLSLSALFGA